jgi:carboxyl-terminal processing protease
VKAMKKILEKIKIRKNEMKETITERRNGFKLIEVIVLMIIAASIGVGIGISTVFLEINKDNLKHYGDTSTSDDNIKEIIDTYNSIIENYYTDVDKDELSNNAIRGMMETLGDPYSTYMDDEQTTSFDERMKGDYQGIGAEITTDKNGNIVIVNIFKGSPAEKAGLLPSDIVIAVDSKSTNGMSATDVASLLKGKANTAVKVKVLRGETEKEFSLTRNRVVIPSITSQTFTRNNKKIGYIEVDIFSDNTYDQFRTAVLNLEKQNINSLVIDVRDNSGGYLNRVSEMISMFLSKDKVIYQLQDKEHTEKIYSFTDEKRTYPVAVLINNYSASASEILAAAFKESYGATIIGVNSYGKGTVQQTFKLETGGMVKYTVQKWLTPNGNWINEVGIKPDIKIEQNENYYENKTIENDTQLNAALETLSTK